jgi:L-methionine (R)-S-oxide reductase
MCHVRSFVFFSGVQTGMYLVQSTASDDAFQFTPPNPPPPIRHPQRKLGYHCGTGGGRQRDTPAFAGVTDVEVSVLARSPTKEEEMYQFDISAGSKADLYRDLLAALDALTADERDPVANMANAAALVWEYLPDLNWAGFYRLVPEEQGGELVLGPFQGKVACIRIPVGKGVCGAAAATLTTQLVEDVHAFPGHIACDAASRSELVVPVTKGGTLIAVLDLDSPELARFDAEDAAGCEALAALLGQRL